MIGKRTSSLPGELQSQEIFRLLTEESSSGAYIIRNDLFRYVNPAFERIFGYTRDEIIDKLGPTELTAPEDRALMAEIVRRGKIGEDSGEKYTLHGLRKDGRTLAVEISGKVVRDRNQSVFVGTVSDQTELSRVQNNLRQFLDEDIAGFYIADPYGFIRDCNETFLKLFSFRSKTDALSTNFASLYPMTNQHASLLELLRERKQIIQHEAEYVRRDGTRLYVAENVVGEFDPMGKLKSVRGYILDQTGKRKLEGQLYQSQRLENLGTLVGGIAHDFNNVLAIIAGHTSVIHRTRSDEEKFENSVDAIKKASKRGAHVVKQLLTFARKVELVTESVNVKDTLDEIVTLCRETFNQKIAFAMDIQQNLPTIHADPNQLHQVLLNLCVNARDAMPTGGTISMTASRVNRSVLNGNFMDVEAQEYILLKISDTGLGMSNETLSHIFEPFYTTKKQGQGTGLGLSVVYGIIKSHHGFIDVRSREGKGTTFSIYLPIPMQRIEEPKAAPEIGNVAMGSGETILVVEDEAPLREFVETTLKDSGYRVLSACDGLEGAEVFARHQQSIDLVLLDMGLPKMTGGELLSVVKKLHPAARVIAASGYLEPEIKSEIFSEGALDFLSKPYMSSELLLKISRALNLQTV